MINEPRKIKEIGEFPDSFPYLGFRVRVWLVALIPSILILLAYLLYSLHMTGGRLTPPLDDSYIHFQFAKRLAGGHFFSYYPGGPYSTAASSFLYPVILAAGYLIGFRGDFIFVWALLLSLFWVTHSHLLLGRILYRLDNKSVSPGFSPPSKLWIWTTAFLLSCGNMMFVLYSGMEVALLVWLMLLVMNNAQDWFYENLKKEDDASEEAGKKSGFSRAGFAISSSLLCLSRPEGLFLVVLLFTFMWIRNWKKQGKKFPWHAAVCAASVTIAYFILNQYKTGYFFVTGMKAKSLFYDAGTQDFTAAIMTGFQNYWKFWNSHTGTLFLPGLQILFLPLVLIGSTILLKKDWEIRSPGFGSFVFASMLIIALSTMFSTVTFNHALRYQAVTWPMIAVTLGAAFLAIRKILISSDSTRLLGLFCVLIVGLNLINMPEHIDLYGKSAGKIRFLNVEVTRHAAGQLPENSWVGAHDIGAVAYYGDFSILDVYGLATPRYQRPLQNGNSSIVEQFENEKKLPGYFIGFLPWLSYEGITNGREKALYSNRYAPKTPWGWTQMTFFQVEYPLLNSGNKPLRFYLLEGVSFAAEVDVADISSEEESHYDNLWKPHSRRPKTMSKIASVYDAPDHGVIFDAGRPVYLEEKFMIDDIEKDKSVYIIVGRFLAESETVLHLYVNETEQPEIKINSAPNNFQEIRWIIPSEILSSNTEIRMVPVGKRPLYSFHYWIYEYDNNNSSVPENLGGEQK